MEVATNFLLCTWRFWTLWWLFNKPVHLMYVLYVLQQWFTMVKRVLDLTMTFGLVHRGCRLLYVLQQSFTSCMRYSKVESVDSATQKLTEKWNIFLLFETKHRCQPLLVPRWHSYNSWRMLRFLEFVSKPGEGKQKQKKQQQQWDQLWVPKFLWKPKIVTLFFISQI